MEVTLLGLTNHKNGIVSSKEIVATNSGAPVMHCNASLIKLMKIPNRTKDPRGQYVLHSKLFTHMSTLPNLYSEMKCYYCVLL